MPAEANTKARRHSAVDEVTPLLAASGSGATVNAAPNEEAVIEAAQNATDAEDDDKPLPIGQIVLLCYARLVEPIGKRHRCGRMVRLLFVGVVADEASSFLLYIPIYQSDDLRNW